MHAQRTPRDPQPIPPVDRVLAKIRVHPLGCWEYTGKIGRAGYGIVKISVAPVNGKRLQKDLRAHRVVYEDWVGPIPDGLVLDHLCCNTRCVNPWHLEAVTHAENARRMWARGRAAVGPGSKPRKTPTHCRRGHLLDEANTHVHGNRRICVTCRVARDARNYERRKARRAQQR